MPEPEAPSKPPRRRARRIWLFAPYIAAAILAVAGSVGWFKAKFELERRVDNAAKVLRTQGFQVSWASRRVDGFPFRLDLTLQAPRIADRTGWALSAPQIKGEAFAYAPGHWVFAAPLGATVVRPGKGALDVTGQAIRASVSGLGSPVPRFSFQGLKLAFTPQPGAAPASLGAADLLEMHLQPGPDDQAALLIRLDDGRSPGANGAGLALTWDSRLSHLSALTGTDWPSAVRHWTAAGGAMAVVKAKLTLGGVLLETQPASLTVSDDGHLQGALPLGLSQGRMAKTVFGSAPLALTFQNGVARLGPLGLGPAFRVF